RRSRWLAAACGRACCWRRRRARHGQRCAPIGMDAGGRDKSDAPIPPREAVNGDAQVKALWHVSAVNASRRLDMSDHSWVHVQIVLNIGLRLARILFRRGVTPSIVTDFALSERDAEVVVAAGCMLHCLGLS